MRKQILLTVLALLGCCTAVRADVEINETNFPDATFRNWVLSQEYGKDRVLTDAEIAGVTSIDVSLKNIQSLKGIEYFTALKSLICSNSRLTKLDVSKNTALTKLDCTWNRLTSLDVSKNTALTTLDCSSNRLTVLDVSKNTALIKLDCTWNRLTSLDVSKNTALKYLLCCMNLIKGTAMDVLVESLPTISKGNMYVIYYGKEDNIMTTAQAAAAKAKGWIPQYTDGSCDEKEGLIWKEYEGSSQ